MARGLWKTALYILCLLSCGLIPVSTAAVVSTSISTTPASVTVVSQPTQTMTTESAYIATRTSMSSEASGTVNPMTSANRASVVSASSSFFALLSLAFLCMAMPSGSMAFELRLDSRYFRISPLVCIVDAFWMWITLFRMTNRGSSVSRAAQAVLAFRVRASGGGARQEALDALAKDTTFRIVVALPATLQYVKICGMRGVPLVSMVGTFYMIFYITMELFFFMANEYFKKKTADDPPEQTEVYRREKLKELVAEVQDLYPRRKYPERILSAPLRDEDLLHLPMALHCLTLVIFFCAVAIWYIRACIERLRTDDEFRNEIEYMIPPAFAVPGYEPGPLLLSVLLFGVYYVISEKVYAVFGPGKVSTFLPVLILTGLVFSVGLVLYTFSVLGTTWTMLVFGGRMLTGLILMAGVGFFYVFPACIESGTWPNLFMFQWLSVQTIYFLMFYNSAGTYKPGWTEYLG